MTVSIEPGVTEPHHAGGRHPAKWAALVDDVLLPMPRRQVPVGVIKDQAGLAPEFVLVRDHNSPEDVVLADDGSVDLAEGNVFYRLGRCEVQPRGRCESPPKRAFVVDDRAEVTVRADQTGKTLRDLFALALHTRLFRDLESPDEQPVGPDDRVRFEDGPVFYTRAVEAGLKITVNSRVFTEHDGVKPHMTGRDVAALVYPDNPADTRVWLVSDGNREIGLDERLTIRGCEVFDVARKNVTGGYESSRVEREVELLRASGLRVTLLSSPAPAVVYHDLRASPSGPVPSADVLVPVPQAYPGQFIDWAYLPEGSTLIGRVKGSAQEHRIRALGAVWRQISYHPHNGGGGPAWNPTVHGFHTYAGELISWLRDA
jgi:hypothetical protein